ncbi:HK97 family phage prohead protease [Rhizobium sp. KVB221]|uniref:HK97 family phage prohead protease n=1 Tax=Rhizobium setariae TaxID=2801340 RepID=A0A936YUW3_9HYPH|nr:HK97 family phage prohead protease [Rhizobium setariae]MBL0375214.1 HK97 family phage prohead protease [Rhizobium setariae]
MNFRKNFDVSAMRLSVVSDLGIKAQPDGMISGYASPFGGAPDFQGDIVAPGAFTRTLREQKAEGVVPAMLWHHKQDEPIGKWLSIAEDGFGLAVTGQINLKTEYGLKAFNHIVGGSATGLSIGFLLPEGGRNYNRDGSFTLTDIDLIEISVTPTPANRRARIATVKSINSKTELVDLLREAGLAKTAAQRVAAGGWPALSNADHQKAIDLAAQIDAATAKIRSL